MAKILFTPGYCYDDLLLVPRYSDIRSRFSNEIDTSINLFPKRGNTYTLKLPVISANMVDITEYRTANILSDLGALGIVHRFMPINYHIQQLQSLTGKIKVGCVGVNEHERIEKIDPYINAWLIDVAHGHHILVKETVAFIQQHTDKPIIAGNIASVDGAKFLADLGVECIKIHIGSSQICSTRLNTGNGFPTATNIMQCKDALKSYPDVTIIADGGLKHPGDVVKAIGLGADAVMTGSLFAGCLETPGEVEVGLTHKYKIYRGSASLSVQKERKKQVAVEGVVKKIPYKGTIKDVIDTLTAGLRSGMSYQGAHSIRELQQNAKFIVQTAQGQKESGV